MCELSNLGSTSTQPEPDARSTQSRYLHGIDFKNPFTMSKRSQMLPNPRVATGEPFLFISRLVAMVELIGIEPMT